MKLSNSQITTAKEKARAYLEERRVTLENFENIDNGSELKDIFDIGFSGASADGESLSWEMTDKQLSKLIENAPDSNLAREMLNNYAKQVPTDKRLLNCEVVKILSSPPPKRKKGRTKETMRDYFLLCAIGLLVNEGLSRPKSETASPNSNSACVLEEILKDMRIKGAYLGRESLVKIWKRRNEIAKDAIDAAHVLGTN